MAKNMECSCTSKSHGVCALVLGLLILANAQWAIVSWPIFVGIIVALAGLVKLAMPKN
jgi:uncharacterized membrane protein HdeD (DUF308 family)